MAWATFRLDWGNFPKHGGKTRATFRLVMKKHKARMLTQHFNMVVKWNKKIFFDFRRFKCVPLKKTRTSSQLSSVAIAIDFQAKGHGSEKIWPLQSMLVASVGYHGYRAMQCSQSRETRLKRDQQFTFIHACSHHSYSPSDLHFKLRYITYTALVYRKTHENNRTNS